MAKKQKDNTVKTRFVSIETFKQEHPEFNMYLPVDGTTEINGTRLTLQQLEDIKKYFGRDFTLMDIELFYEENKLDWTNATWPKAHRHIIETTKKKKPKDIIPNKQKPVKKNLEIVLKDKPNITSPTIALKAVNKLLVANGHEETNVDVIKNHSVWKEHTKKQKTSK